MIFGLNKYHKIEPYLKDFTLTCMSSSYYTSKLVQIEFRNIQGFKLVIR